MTHKSHPQLIYRFYLLALAMLLGTSACARLAPLDQQPTPWLIPQSRPPVVSLSSTSETTATPFPEAATAVAIATEISGTPVGALCTVSGSDLQMTYNAALDIARRSECVQEGKLLEAHLCNEQSGTWWLGLEAPRPGCNPACVVSIADGTAVVNWRCTGLLEPPAATATTGNPTPAPIFVPPSPLATNAPPTLATLDPTPANDTWAGTVMRQTGIQVRYSLLMEDGAIWPLRSAGDEVQAALADAAWRGAPIALRGAPTMQGELLPTAVLSIGAPALNPRNMAPFAFASASSTAAADEGGPYDAWSAVNGSLELPWCEGLAGPGLGEWLQLDFSAPLVISELRLSNGFDQDGFLYESNDQVARATFQFDGGESLTWEFAVMRGLQSVPIDPPITAQSMRLVIDGVNPGWKFDDACIGEIEVWARTS
jgi:hypothetical protein